MPTLLTLFAFSAAAIPLILIPGPNVMFIISRGIGQGRRAAVTSALGVEAGMLVHTVAAVVGLTALVASSAMVFAAVKYAGAGYLVWMGIRAIRSLPGDLALERGDRAVPLLRTFIQGLVVNVLNPKVGLFFLAFLPQFVDPDRGSVALQILLFGCLFMAYATISDLAYALASGRIGMWLGTRAWVARQRNRFSGVVYIALGILAATSGSATTRKT